MIRAMMWNPRDGDQRFKDTMHDFVATYKFKGRDTEDFKAMVEKHMSPRNGHHEESQDGLVLR